MKILKALMIFAMAAFILCSCEYEWIKPVKTTIPDVVSFSADVMPIFNNGCNTGVCHGPGATPPDLSEANAYNSLITGGYVDTDTPESSTLYVTMTTGSMRPYVQNPGDADIILAWIEQGAENN
jgi:hypothetical protein